MRLKMWIKGRKGEDGMTVHQERGLDGKSGDGENLRKRTRSRFFSKKQEGQASG